MILIEGKCECSKSINRVRSPSSHKEEIFSNIDFMCWRLWLMKSINEDQIAAFKRKKSQSSEILSFIEGMISEKKTINKEIKSLINMELKYGGR